MTNAERARLIEHYEKWGKECVRLGIVGEAVKDTHFLAFEAGYKGSQRELLDKVMPVLEDWSEAVSEMNMYHVPFTGTDVFTWRTEDPQETQVAKRHSEPFKSGEATKFLESTEQLRELLSELRRIGSLDD